TVEAGNLVLRCVPGRADRRGPVRVHVRGVRVPPRQLLPTVALDLEAVERGRLRPARRALDERPRAPVAGGRADLEDRGHRRIGRDGSKLDGEVVARDLTGKARSRPSGKAPGPSRQQAQGQMPQPKGRTKRSGTCASEKARLVAFGETTRARIQPFAGD